MVAGGIRRSVSGTNQYEQTYDIDTVHHDPVPARARAREGRLVTRNERDPRIDALSDGCCEFEPLIVETPVQGRPRREAPPDRLGGLCPFKRKI